MRRFVKNSCLQSLYFPLFTSLVLLNSLYHSVYNGAQGFKLAPPEFTDPVKNISVPAGSNIEFFCNVKHAGVNRIMWLKREDDKQILLGINNLVITKNARVAISLLPRSDDVSQSILYINNVEEDDNGIYHCIVNSSPMLVQVGILEVKQVHPANDSFDTRTLVVDPQEIVPTRSEMTGSTPPDVTTLQATTARSPQCNESFCNTTDQKNSVRSKTMFCVDVNGLWSQTRDGAQYFISWMYTYLQILF